MENLVSIPHKESEIIDKLEQLLDFGAKSFSTIRIEHDSDLKSALLFELMGAVHNYSEAILLLMRGGKVQAGIVLQRSLVEALINTEYILTEKTEDHAARFILDDEYDRKRFMDDLDKFKQKYPDHNKLTELYKSPKEAQKFISERVASIDEIERKYGKSLGLPKLRNKAIEVDQLKKNSNLEFTYLTIYWFFSGLAHLTARGLNNFIEQQDNKNRFIIGTTTEGIERLAISTFTIYLGFLGTMSNHFGTPPDSDLKSFNDYFLHLSKN